MSARKQIVVCGATGFIGRNIVAALARKGEAEIVAIHHARPRYEAQGVRWIAADLTREEGARAAVAGADVVIQAAATTSGAKDIVERPYIHTTDNAVMNSLLLRACHEAGVGQFVFFSCSIMYQPGDRPVRESDLDLRQPLQSNYFAAGWTKMYVERMCEFYAGLGRTRTAALRHSNVYGPFDKFDLERSHMLGATVTKAMTAPEGGVLTVWGSGEEARDLLYIGDLVRCVEMIVERQTAPFALYNVGAGRAVTVREAVERVIAATGRKLRIEHDLSQPTIPVSLALDCTRIADEIGWRPETALDRGLAETVAWWRGSLSSKSELHIFFDAKEKLIRGPEFSIKHAGRRPDPPYHDLFIYEDASGRFCFVASRNAWDEEQKYWRDTQIYDVRWIGFPAFQELHVLFENQITPEHRRRALQNIERALWFDQSAFYEGPVKGVRISVK